MQHTSLNASLCVQFCLFKAASIVSGIGTDFTSFWVIVVGRLLSHLQCFDATGMTGRDHGENEI